jgi:hypothetical protein
MGRPGEDGQQLRRCQRWRALFGAELAGALRAQEGSRKLAIEGRSHDSFFGGACRSHILS